MIGKGDDLWAAIDTYVDQATSIVDPSLDQTIAAFKDSLSSIGITQLDPLAARTSLAIIALLKSIDPMIETFLIHYLAMVAKGEVIYDENLEG